MTNIFAGHARGLLAGLAVTAVLVAGGIGIALSGPPARPSHATGPPPGALTPSDAAKQWAIGTQEGKDSLAAAVTCADPATYAYMENDDKVWTVTTKVRRSHDGGWDVTVRTVDADGGVGETLHVVEQAGRYFVC